MAEASFIEASCIDGFLIQATPTSTSHAPSTNRARAVVGRVEIDGMHIEELEEPGTRGTLFIDELGEPDELDALDEMQLGEREYEPAATDLYEEEALLEEEALEYTAEWILVDQGFVRKCLGCEHIHNTRGGSRPVSWCHCGTKLRSAAKPKPSKRNLGTSQSQSQSQSQSPRNAAPKPTPSKRKKLAVAEPEGGGRGEDLSKRRRRSRRGGLLRFQSESCPLYRIKYWEKEEDATIVALVGQYGAKKWSSIATHLPGRVGKQCRERWHNHLDPNVRKGTWTVGEDRLIIDSVQRFG